MLMMMRKVMIWKKGGQYDVTVVREIGFRTGNTVSQNLSTVPVPAHTVPVPGMGIHRPVDMTVSLLTPR